MMIKTFHFEIKTKGFCDIHDITPYVRKALEETRARSGLCTVITPGATAGVTTIEFEDGVLEDLKTAIERMAPKDIPYEHDQAWGDGNGFSHVRSALIGPSVSVPFENGDLILGTWQQIVLLDFDNRPRRRRFVVQILGEGKE